MHRSFLKLAPLSMMTPEGRDDASAGPADTFDYVVVGSGAGGAPLAANLAEAGFSVLVLEAGGDDENDNYRVPAFHARASEDPAYSWDFFVRHYTSDALADRDTKICKAQGGIFYPRAATVGGCTAHNAMITILPHDSDWDHIAQLTGDDSWQAANMRQYFERLERCTYLPRPLKKGSVWRGHGFDGWLTTSRVEDQISWLSAVEDGQLRDIAIGAVKESLGHSVFDILRLGHSLLDPNDDAFPQQNPEGLFLVPTAIRDGQRNGARERLLDARDKHPGTLTILTHALATRVVLDENSRATGVEYLAGEHLYRADKQSAEAGPGQAKRVNVTREVILAGGAFNSPQLLKLSGIGPRDELEALGITVLVERDGVGKNLQDRYEIGVVNELKSDIGLLEPATFTGDQNDPAFVTWHEEKKGIYATNGVVLGIIKRSKPDLDDPDLIIFGLPGSFEGYAPGYSLNAATHKNYFTWAVLKAHTANTTGTVTLRSTDPLDTPSINFRYFDDGAGGQADLDAVAEGVAFARRIMTHVSDSIVSETAPRDPDPREYIRNNAWGHHASCTNKMGVSSDASAVVDSRFRVIGTTGLRVVDASVFPRIPGFFLVTPVYMISEKASDVIIADAKQT